MFNNLKDLFTVKHGVYNKNLQFWSIIICIVVIIFFTKYFSKTYGFVIILIAFALYISNEFVSVNDNFANDFNRLTMVKLQRLQEKVNDHINKRIASLKVTGLSKEEIQKIYENNKLSSLYIDANMINFLDSVIKLYDYDTHAFYLLLKGTNNILKIKDEIDEFYEQNKKYPVNISEMFQSALELRTNTINNMHNFIYSLPKTKVTLDYLNTITDRYSVLISRITDSINSSYKNSIRLNGIDATTKFVSYNTTKPYDPKLNHPITVTDKDHLVDFYM